MEIDACLLIKVFVTILCLYFAQILIEKFFAKQKLNRWKKTPKDVVIVHGFPRTDDTPNPSPFVLKLETYLRMANIPYKFDSKDTFGPLGKTPWISMNGEHVADSEIIIKFLSKKFDKDLSGNYTDEQLAVGNSLRTMLEDNVFWGLTRAVFTDDDTRHVVAKSKGWPFFVEWYLCRMYSGYLHAQGTGRLPRQQVYEFTLDKIRTLSLILGQNKFLLGDEPCEYDAACFGFLAIIIYGAVTLVPAYSNISKDFPNLKAYCERMKSKFWPDWDTCLAKK